MAGIIPEPRARGKPHTPQRPLDVHEEMANIEGMMSLLPYVQDDFIGKLGMVGMQKDHDLVQSMRNIDAVDWAGSYFRGEDQIQYFPTELSPRANSDPTGTLAHELRHRGIELSDPGLPGIKHHKDIVYPMDMIDPTSEPRIQLAQEQAGYNKTQKIIDAQNAARVKYLGMYPALETTYKHPVREYTFKDVIDPTVSSSGIGYEENTRELDRLPSYAIPAGRVGPPRSYWEQLKSRVGGILGRAPQ